MDQTNPQNFLGKIDFNHSEVAEVYDELPLWSAPFGLLMLERIPMQRGLMIVDVGAGTGFLSIELAQRCGDSTVYAVDPWKGATDRLRRKVAILNLPNVQVIERDAATIDLPTESVDLVVSNLGINNFENADAVLQTCARILKRGGKLFLTSNLVGHMREFYDAYRQTLTELSLEEFLPKLESHIHHRATVSSIRERLERAGLEIEDVTERSFEMRFADGSSMLRHYFIRLGFVDEWSKIVVPDKVEEVFATLENNLNSFARERGELSLTIPMACVQARKV
ncbi:MAG TPA: methyltransferase domain-containing protein [Gemmatimonadaceae bacterium]|nr:methyltransferase domain-containing protein [Gemmatimonadaceae bacterium]